MSSSQTPLRDNTQHSRQTSMSQVGFEPTTSAGEQPQIYALDRAATGTGNEVSTATQWTSIASVHILSNCHPRFCLIKAVET